MDSWFHSRIVETGRLPLFCFFAAMVVAFGLIRLSVRLIRARVRWWPGNLTPGGLHIHHVVFGVVLLLIGGVAALSVPPDTPGPRSIAAVLFGVGAALVLDEFALILHLRDVYWTETGRTSIDAVFVAVALTGMLLLGIRPIGLADAWPPGDEPYRTIGHLTATAINLGLAVVTLLKGKIWTGLFGLFAWPLLYVGAWRLARPGSPWARWRYRTDTRRGQRCMSRALWRERRLRRPLIRGKIRVQELIAGHHAADGLP